MITYYQPLSRSFFQSKPDTIALGVKRYYYGSFEDGLWDLLQNKEVPVNAVILIPSFYCMDVAENMRSHGYIPTFYDLDKHFQVSAKNLLRSISRHKPAVVVLFHACGISLRILQNKQVVQSIAKKALVIEDGVHRLIKPSTVRLLHDNHFLMDSLRKVSPLPGSFLYGTTRGLSYQQTSRVVGCYSFMGWFLYLLFRLTFEIGHHFRSATTLSFAHERILKAHDNLIGNHILGHKGLPLVSSLQKYVHFSSIEQKKHRQVLLYEKELYATTLRDSIYRISIQQSDYKKLHVFPVGLIRASTKLLKQLQKIGVVAWYKFDDCPWSKKRNVLFLPLGFHVKNEDIIASAKVIRHFVNS
ncbi:MAG TPA: hypothetical protein VJ246_04100 [Patescibacteria group bacterium]|nr:hypothetical protein [Patescibacteria group bacterium]